MMVDDPPSAASDSVADAFLLVSTRQLEPLKRALTLQPSLVHQHRWSGASLLHRAVGTGDLALVALLLDHGADPNDRAAWGWYSPLHLACKRGDADLIWLLLERGAKWGAVDKTHKTPLQWAVRAGKASVAYRVDQQLHAKAKQAMAKGLEPDDAPDEPTDDKTALE